MISGDIDFSERMRDSNERKYIQLDKGFLYLPA